MNQAGPDSNLIGSTIQLFLLQVMSTLSQYATKNDQIHNYKITLTDSIK